MQCSHTALPCVSLQLVPAPPPYYLFRDPYGRSRARAGMSPEVPSPLISNRSELLRVRLSPENRQVIRVIKAAGPEGPAMKGKHQG